MNKAELLESLSQQANTESENLRIKMGNRVVYGQTSKEFRDELDDPKAEIISEAISRSSEASENVSEEEQVSGVIEITNGDDKLFRQNSDGSIGHNQLQQQEMSQDLSTPEEPEVEAQQEQEMSQDLSTPEEPEVEAQQQEASLEMPQVEVQQQQEASTQRSFFDSLKKQIDQVPDSIGSTKKWLGKFAENANELYQQAEKVTQKVADTAKEVQQEVGELVDVAKPAINKVVEKTKEVAQSEEAQALRSKVGDKVRI